MKLSKEIKKNLLLARLGDAFENTYHNATLSYVDDEHCEEFNDELQFMIQYEFDNFAESINNAYCQKKKYKKNNKIRESKITIENDVFHQSVLRYLGGELTTYGRGGRTVKMSKLGLNFDDVQWNDYQDLSKSNLTELILALEWLNDYVRNWCKTYPKNLYRHFKMEISK